jgi:phosphohistidine phosphatase
MDLYVVRHAIAADAERGQDDSERPLTEDGKERFAKSVRGMHRMKLQFERVLHSPWKRAHQTAKLLEPIVFGPLESTDLLCKSPSDALLQLIRRHVEEGPLAVVGHQPWLGELIGLLTIGDAERGQAIDLKKGSLVWLEGEPKRAEMRIQAYLPPRILRAIR